MRITIRRPEDVPAGTPMAVSLRTTSGLNTGDSRTFRPQYVTRPSPCNLDCPAGTDVRTFLTLAARGDAVGAWRTILEHNPLPGVCGRVCYHPCEAACNRTSIDERLAVHAVERAVAAQAVREQARPDTIDAGALRDAARVAIVGSGPAGLSCAYHVARQGHAAVVFEGEDEPGGMLRYRIPAYRLPRHVLGDEIDHLRQLGIEFRVAARLGTTLSWAELHEYDAVFVGVGRQRSQDPGIPGHELRGVRPALDFLREVNAGQDVTIGGRVVVIGGGDTALDAARVAVRKGARATIVYRRTRADMPAHPDEIAQAEAEGVQFVFQAAPVRFQGTRGVLTSVHCQRTRPGSPDASGRCRPELVPGNTMTLACHHALTAVGEELDADVFASAMEVAAGKLAADRWGRTPKAPLFAGGDASTGAGTVVEAIGSGRRAALAIDAWLRGMDLTPEETAGERVGLSSMNLFYFGRAPRVPLAMLHPGHATASFKEVATGLAWNEAVQEAGRCLSCGGCTECGNCVTFCPDAAVAPSAEGGYAIDFAHCKGCGLCVAECPRGAMTLQPEETR